MGGAGRGTSTRVGVGGDWRLRVRGLGVGDDWGELGDGAGLRRLPRVVPAWQGAEQLGVVALGVEVGVAQHGLVLRGRLSVVVGRVCTHLRQRVVGGVEDGPVLRGPEELDDVEVLPLTGDVARRPLEAVEEGGVGEAIQEVLHAAKVAVATGEEERRLALQGREGGREGGREE